MKDIIIPMNDMMTPKVIKKYINTIFKLSFFYILIPSIILVILITCRERPIHHNSTKKR